MIAYHNLMTQGIPAIDFKIYSDNRKELKSIAYKLIWLTYFH